MSSEIAKWIKAVLITALVFVGFGLFAAFFVIVLEAFGLAAALISVIFIGMVAWVRFDLL